MASRGINRRQFLRLSAAVAAAGAVTACGGGTTAPAPTKSASGSTTASSPAAAAGGSPTAAGAAPTIGVANAATATPAAQSAAPAKFKESPLVADMVKAGKVPAVEQRLPANPRVIKPRESAGVYGGVWHRQYRGLSDRVGPTKLLEMPAIQWEAPEPTAIRLTANWVEKWDQNADATEYTFYLRKGLK
ncbi:MAG: twin-arginine translocation signal domain-containing protein, partial [Thermomicrobia bacterium]|nr:twin-arginine translocation signal domain-containing protein [Thermomicrobia bacterium]